VKLLLILLITVSCGIPAPMDLVQSSGFIFGSSNPYFDSYKRQFESEYILAKSGDINTSAIRINFVKEIENNRAVGVCYQFIGGAEIVIKSGFWNKISSTSRKNLIYHELGHCALNRGHLDTKHKGYNISIMNSTMISDFYLDNFENVILKELFTSNPTNMIEEIDLL